MNAVLRVDLCRVVLIDAAYATVPEDHSARRSDASKDSAPESKHYPARGSEAKRQYPAKGADAMKDYPATGSEAMKDYPA